MTERTPREQDVRECDELEHGAVVILQVDLRLWLAVACGRCTTRLPNLRGQKRKEAVQEEERGHRRPTAQLYGDKQPPHHINE